MHITDLPERSQDHLKKIYDLQEWSGTGAAALSGLAEAMGQPRSTTSEAVKRLANTGLVEHAPYADITLTAEGKSLALALVRRHRLIETYLVAELGYAIDEVHDEAEVLEHAVSDRFVAAIDDRLGNPQRDPHGDPIPAVDGSLPDEDTVPLSEVSAGTTVVIRRIRDRDSEMLRYLADHNVRPGSSVTMGERPYPEMASLVLEDGSMVQLGAHSLGHIVGVVVSA